MNKQRSRHRHVPSTRQTESGRSALASQLTGTSTDDGTSGEFGANEWLVDELYEQYVADKNSVDKSWWPVLESYRSHVSGGSGAPAESVTPPAAAGAAEADAAGGVTLSAGAPLPPETWER